ncbi:hypothetical protein [Massilia sp. SYSU DXS3249]
MKELNPVEVEIVCGAGFSRSVGSFLGWLYGAGAKTQKRVDSYENEMLGAMQYGA